MQAQARSYDGWPSPPAKRLPRGPKEEARSRCPSPADVEGLPIRFFQGIGQAHAFPSGAEAERALMRAILVDAIRCLAGEVTPAHDRMRLRSQARRWIASRDERWPFSFENVCAALDLQTARLRTLLLDSPAVLRSICRTLVERLAP